MTDKKDEPTGLGFMRLKFDDNQVSQLPKPTRKQTDEVKADFKKGVRCKICGGWHHPNVIHLDYVGHAALTDRLLDCDPEWNWHPVAKTEDGLPVFDQIGGMWIALTVCGITRLGYGHPDGKTGGNAIKEVIGDALRNAAMRFGAALDLWHKGDLHVLDGEPEKKEPIKENSIPATLTPLQVWMKDERHDIECCKTMDELTARTRDKVFLSNYAQMSEGQKKFMDESTNKAQERLNAK